MKINMPGQLGKQLKMTPSESDQPNQVWTWAVRPGKARTAHKLQTLLSCPASCRVGMATWNYTAHTAGLGADMNVPPCQGQGGYKHRTG